jgi:hypothetical protein
MHRVTLCGHFIACIHMCTRGGGGGGDGDHDNRGIPRGGSTPP